MFQLLQNVLIVFLVKEQLDGFGVPTKIINRAIKTKSLVTAEDINLDDDHPPAEALGYCITHIKPFLREDAWKKVSISSRF